MNPPTDVKRLRAVVEITSYLANKGVLGLDCAMPLFVGLTRHKNSDLRLVAAKVIGDVATPERGASSEVLRALEEVANNDTHPHVVAAAKRSHDRLQEIRSLPKTDENSQLHRKGDAAVRSAP